ncbi:MAG: AAA family ATPase, partial [Bacteroidota bacterium]
MKRQSLIAWEEGSSSTLYRLVRTAITQMVEGATDLRYSPQREEVVVVFKNNEVYPLDYLSDGQRTTLTLVGDLATRMARLNPHLGEDALSATPGVVLIDELGLHLHPTWQRHIVQDLRRTFPQVQFITTTHSPQIISEVEPSALIHLKR